MLLRLMFSILPYNHANYTLVQIMLLNVIFISCDYNLMKYSSDPAPTSPDRRYPEMTSKRSVNTRSYYLITLNIIKVYLDMTVQSAGRNISKTAS